MGQRESGTPNDAPGVNVADGGVDPCIFFRRFPIKPFQVLLFSEPASGNKNSLSINTKTEKKHKLK